MQQVNQYRLFCNTEQAYITGWGESAPVVCYNNDEHSIDLDSITLIDTVSKKDVNIKTIETVLPSQEKAFPDYTGYPTFIKGTHGSMQPGVQSFLYLSFDQTVRIQGGGFCLSKNATFGDYIDVDLTYGVTDIVVGQFISTIYPIPDSNNDWVHKTPDTQPIPVGVCLRVGYTNTGSENVLLSAWFLTRRVPDA